MIYLNQAATTYPKPQCVLDAYTAAFTHPPAGQYRSSSGGKDAKEACRKSLGKLLGIQETDRIFFSSGATDSSNALIYGLPLAGKTAAASQTEHNSILRPLMNLKDQVGRVVVIPCDSYGKIHLEALEWILKEEKPVAVFVSHCSNVTGMIQDMEAIGQMVHEHEALFVADVSQSAGCIPVDADAWKVDALIFTGHKSLFGVPGTGGYYVRSGIYFRPYRFGGTGRNSSRLTYENGDYEYEPGTANDPGIAALDAGVSWILEKGVTAIAKGEQRLMKKLYEGLDAIPGVKTYGTWKTNLGPVLSFNIADLLPGDTAYILQNSYDITVRTGLHCAPLIHEAMRTMQSGTVRVSISALTAEEDVDALLEAVNEICTGMEIVK